MIKNLENGEIYQNATHAAHLLSVTSNDIRLHLNGEVRNIRGMRLKYIRPPKKRKVHKRHDLEKPVQCIETGRVYCSIQSAAKRFSVPPYVMARHLKRLGKRRERIRGLTFTWAKTAHHNDLFGPIING